MWIVGDRSWCTVPGIINSRNVAPPCGRRTEMSCRSTCSHINIRRHPLYPPMCLDDLCAPPSRPLLLTSLLLPPQLLARSSRWFIGAIFVSFPPYYKTRNCKRRGFIPHTVPPVGLFESLFLAIFIEECFKPVLYNSRGGVFEG